MTLIEGIVGLIASVFAIVGTMIYVARYLGRRFDKWAEAVVSNSQAIRTLTTRVGRLEIALKIPPKEAS
jgi:hypothetical protein